MPPLHRRSRKRPQPNSGSARRFGLCSHIGATLPKIRVAEPEPRAMRLPVTTLALIALSGPVNAGPVRACEQLSALVEGAVRQLLAKPAEPQPAATQLRAQFHACLSARNICSVVFNTRAGKKALVEGDVTADLPQQHMSDHGQSSVIFLVRSIPRMPNDANQYCLVSEQSGGATPVQQWDVYGWVLAPKGGEPLPLQRQALDHEAVSVPGSLRALAAALWFFAQRMSGQPPP
jgi:hypothetical protein